MLAGEAQDRLKDLRHGLLIECGFGLHRATYIEHAHLAIGIVKTSPRFGLGASHLSLHRAVLDELIRGQRVLCGVGFPLTAAT